MSSAVLGEALDGKGLLLNAAFAGLGGGIASGLGQMEGLGSLGEDMLNSGVHFGLDTGKAALIALGRAQTLLGFFLLFCAILMVELKAAGKG